MSFSSDIKQELCRVGNFNRESLRAELYGMLLFGRTFREDKIVFKTESADACRRVTLLLENLYMPIIEKQVSLSRKSSEPKQYRISVPNSSECSRIYHDFGHSKGEVTRRVNRANVFSEELSASFVRGVFLSCGSVSDPSKSYHAEFCVPYKNLSVDLCKILREVTECDFLPKTVTRSGSYIVYFKGSEQICDLLTYIGAPIQAMEIMGTTKENTLFVGDQIFTDVYGAKRTGIYGILVKPIHPKEEIQIVLKRYLEKIVLYFYKRSLKK